MTIISSIESGCEIKLSFGVPLEDVFPDGDVHPALKELFREIYVSLLVSPIKIKTVLSYDIPSCSNLKKAFVSKKDLEQMPAGTLLWILRHFLGSLPLPLLPKYTDSKFYVWLKLSHICKERFTQYVNERGCNQYLVNRLAEELLKLPPVNLLLIGYLVNFMRSLVVSSDSMNKHATVELVRYFTSAIFVRPYNVHRTPKIQTFYHPLMLYLLIKWPEIQKKCIELQPDCFIPIGKRNVKFIHLADLTGSQQIHFSRSFLDTIAECTDSDDTSSEKRVAESCEEDKVSECSDTYTTLPEVDDVLRDIGSQTEGVHLYSSTTQTSTQTPIEGLREFVKDEDRDQFLLYGRLTSYPSVVQSKSFRKVAQTQTEESYEETEQCIADLPKLPTLTTLEKVTDYVQMTNEQNVLERISKIGWTYTSPRTSSENNKINQQQIEPEDDYQFCCDTSNVQSEMTNNNQINDADSLVNLDETTGIEEPLAPKKSKKSLMGLNKFLSSVEWLKILKSKHLSGSASAVYLRSKIKYQKMSGARSNLF